MREIITLGDTRFSNRNLASGMTSIFTSADQFTQLPFKDIYHNHSLHSYSDENKQYITTTKQAEVIYPKRISLDHLKFIYCRSQAEYETLRNLLPPDVWERWHDKIEVNERGKLFSKEWLHIKTVTLTKESADIHFHLPKKREYYGPFKISCHMQDTSTGESHWLKREYADIVAELDDAKFWDFSDKFDKINNYVVEVFIDDNLAYTRRSDDIPF